MTKFDPNWPSQSSESGVDKSSGSQNIHCREVPLYYFSQGIILHSHDSETIDCGVAYG